MADENNTNGAAVQQAVNEAFEAEKKKKKKKRLIIIGVIAAVIIVIALASGSSGEKNVTENSGQNADTQTVQAADVSAAAETQAPDSQDGKIGDYICTVKSAQLCTDWEDKDSVKMTFEFTNNSKDAQSFDIALCTDLYQNGIGLESTFTGSDDEEDLICDVKIRPGTTKEVYKVYKLRDTASPIDVEISELISFNDDKLHYTVTLE